MGIRDWPAAERPREKLLSRGAKALSDAELLAIFLRTGVSGCDAVELARRLLGEFGSLRGLFAADQRSFCQAHGLGEAKYVQLQAVLEMSCRYLDEEMKRGDALTSQAPPGVFCRPDCAIALRKFLPCCCWIISIGCCSLPNFFSELWMPPASIREKSCRQYSNIMRRR